MKQTDTLKFRTDPVSGDVFRRAAARSRLSLSSWIRKACRRELEGVVLDEDLRRDLVHARLKLNRVRELVGDGVAADLLDETCVLLEDRLGNPR